MTDAPAQLVAEAAAYAKRNVNETLASLVACHAATTFELGNERRYYFDRGGWGQLLGLRPDTWPTYREWPPLLGALRRLARWLEEPRLDQLSPYRLTSEARTLTHDLERDFAFAGVALSGAASAHGEQYWDYFVESVERALSTLSTGVGVVALLDEATEKLLGSLRAQRLLLFVGAGLSKRVGYLLWQEYLHSLETELGEPDSLPPASELEWAQTLKDRFVRAGRRDDYFAHIQQTFGPRSPTPYDPLHTALLKLGFRGFVTANFDPVLENAISAENATCGRPACEPLDLGDPRSFAVFDFLRAIATRPSPGHVLHIHGYYARPERVVLAAGDYRDRYGDYQEVDDEGRPANRLLDTPHRKVVWSLLVCHPILFVGFSLSDEAFRHIIGVTQVDFQRGRHLGHFALVAAESEDEELKLRDAWIRAGITPIFYRVLRAGGLPEDHTALDALIEALASEMHIDVALSPIPEFTQRMLNL